MNLIIRQTDGWTDRQIDDCVSESGQWTDGGIIDPYITFITYINLQKL